MVNFREVNDDILKEWLLYREDAIFSLSCEEDRKQLNILDDNFLDYLDYWNEKYYRNGFVDGSQITMGCFEE